MAFDFQPAVDGLFSVFGSAAEYYPQGGASLAVTVVTRRPAVDGALLGAGVRLSGPRQEVALEADVRRSELGDRVPARGDTMVVGEQPYTVVQEPLLDGEKLVWRLALRETTK